jgi:SAM-dependent methyltransferase
MDPREYDRMRTAEDRHWWYLGMAGISRRLLQRWTPPPGGWRILDAGCGTGGAAESFLAEFGRVLGMDLSPNALRHCRRRGGGAWIGGSVERLPFAVSSFDLVTSFDVLYERGVSSESEALSEFRRVLAPGGRILLRLPALEGMRRSHDTVVHTRRRYTRMEVARMMEAAGFQLELCAYANSLLFPAAFGWNLLERLFPPENPRSDLETDFGIWNSALARILAAEAPLVARGCLPIGLSVFAAGRKP